MGVVSKTPPAGLSCRAIRYTSMPYIWVSDRRNRKPIGIRVSRVGAPRRKRAGGNGILHRLRAGRSPDHSRDRRFRKARWAGSGGGKYREASHVKGERKLPTRRILLLDQVDVKRIRNQARMSQAEFARAFCINPTTLKEWEQGSRKPDVTTRACLSIPGNDRKAINAVAGNRRYRRVTDSSEPFTREMYRHAMPRCFS